MTTDKRTRWTKEVGLVFNTMPRDGTDDSTVWLPRKDLEKRLLDFLTFDGVHICVDGSSGTGKTSIVTTQLHRKSQKYVLIQLTKSMTWADFCKRLIASPSSAERSTEAEGSVGMKGFVPHISLRVTLSSKKNKAANLEAANRSAASWTEADVCTALVEKGAMLFLDDFENANSEMVSRVADMMKLLTQSFKGKVIVVGTGGAYSDLLEANAQLEGRLEEVTIPTLAAPTEAWTFLSIGFDKLSLGHPAKDVRDKRTNLTSKEQLATCVRSVYDAADGLPKALNELGRDIAITGFGRKRISHHDIRVAAEKMLARNIAQCARRFPEIIGLLVKRTEARLVLKHLYERGIGFVHSYEEIFHALEGKLSGEAISLALQELVTAKLIIRAGLKSERIFSANPTLTHTLGVLIESPEKYARGPNAFAPVGQLKLPFQFNEKELENELSKAAVRYYWVDKD